MKTKIGIAVALVLSVLFLAGCQSSAAAQLSETEARDIALQDVGISLNAVSFLHVEKEVDDGITKYDVTFRHDAYEYDYENDAATGKPKITWAEVEGAVKYKVYRSTSKSNGYKVIGEAEALTYEDLTAKKGKTCYYKVVAVGENCESAQSSYVKIKSK